MELNLREVVALWHELYGYQITENGETKTLLKGFLNQKMSLKVKLYVSRLGKILSDEIEILNNAKKELYEKYLIEDGKEITKETFELFNKEIEELMLLKKNIEVSTLWSTDLNANDFASIETEENYPIFYSIVDNTKN